MSDGEGRYVTRWVVMFLDDRGWMDYDSYPTQKEANSVARHLRRLGNVTQVAVRVVKEQSAAQTG